jgi:hypothetical protein
MCTKITLPLLLLASALVAATAGAQVPGANDPDAKELAAYTLTLPALDKALAATKNLVAAAKNDPRFQKQAALKAELKKLEAREEPTEADTDRIEKLRAEIDAMDEAIFPNAGNQTLAQMDAAMRKEPLMAKAIADAGLTPREYAKFLFAYMASGAVASMLEQGVIKEMPKELATSVNPANITFFQTHKAQVEAFQKAMEAIEEPQ